MVGSFRLDVGLQNSWVLYQVHKKEEDPVLSLLDVNCVFMPAEIQFDETRYYQVSSEKQGQCKVCQKNSRRVV